MAGGLGDIMTYYLEGDLGYFPVLHERGFKTKVTAWSVSNQIRPLFMYNSHIDVLTTPPFGPVEGLTDGFRTYAQSVEPEWRLLRDDERAHVPWQQPTFPLTPAEQQMADDITGAPYIAVHPFAGRPERSLMRAGIAREIVDTAAERMLVVVLGGNSLRDKRAPDGSGRSMGTAHLIESYGNEGRNVCSLTNQFSVRLHAYIAQHATKFIGSVSAYNCVAQHFKIPSLVFGSAGNRNSMRAGAGSVFKKMRDNGTAIHYLDQNPKVRELVGRFLT